MSIKTMMAAAALAFAATSASAAVCTQGECQVIGADGQNLSTWVQFDINNIIGEGVTDPGLGASGDFTFSGNFNNDTSGDGTAVAAFLVSVTQGAISNLMLNIVSPGSVAASYALINDQFVNVVLEGGLIEFTLTGTATRGTRGGDPDINLTLEPVPVPASILLMGTALAGFGALRRRKKS